MAKKSDAKHKEPIHPLIKRVLASNELSNERLMYLIHKLNNRDKLLNWIIGISSGIIVLFVSNFDKFLIKQESDSEVLFLKTFFLSFVFFLLLQ